MATPERAPMRDDDPRARAAKRAAELRDSQVDDVGEGKFYIPPDSVPEGWCYEWKRETTYNKEDPSYQVELAQAGWEPVATSRHPEFMPRGSKAPHIRRDGMILMERPLEIVEEARKREQRMAIKQVRDKEEQLGMAPAGQFERQNKDASLVKVNKTFEAIPIPD